MPSVLLFTTTTGYQARAFEDAAREAGIDLVYATDRCHMLEDPWRDRAIAVRFEDPAAAAATVTGTLGDRKIDGVLAAGDATVVAAAATAQALGIPWHTVDGARVSRSKLLARGRLLAADLPVPWFFAIRFDAPLDELAGRLRFPCVIKPLSLSASQGVMRADTMDEFLGALGRLRALLARPELRTSDRDECLVEGYIDGPEFALEGVLEHGALRVLAIFDKPDPLQGPSFEERIYVTPSRLPSHVQRTLASTVAHAALWFGLHHGPIHAECRLGDAGVFVLEIAARPIGGLCARALRFASRNRENIALEELLLRHAAGEPLDGYGPMAGAAGVMMIPIPERGRFRAVEGTDAARLVPGVEDVIVTARPGQLVERLPEGGSYLGFIIARTPQRDAIVDALEDAYSRLRFTFDRAVSIAPAPDDRGA